MKPTLLLLSLVAIALISQTQAFGKQPSKVRGNTKYCSNCRGNHKRPGSFKGMWGMKDEMDDLYDDMDDEEDEAVGSHTNYYPRNHKYHVRRRDRARRKAECATKGPRFSWMYRKCNDCEQWKNPGEAQALGCPIQYWHEADKPRRLRRLKYWNAERNACYKQCEHTADPNDWGRAYCVTECMGETWRL